MATTTGERDIVRLIRDQHDEIKRLFSKVETRPSDDPRDAFECLVRLLAVHETAQEEVVYPLVRSAEPGGDDIAEDRLQEQSNAKNMLSDLERIGVDSDEFAPRFAALIRRPQPARPETRARHRIASRGSRSRIRRRRGTGGPVNAIARCSGSTSSPARTAPAGSPSCAAWPLRSGPAVVPIDDRVPCGR
jgi:hypothetical protein